MLIRARDIEREYSRKIPTQKIGKHLYFLNDMAVWPDPTHGHFPYLYLKILISRFGQVNIFEKMSEASAIYRH